MSDWAAIIGSSVGVLGAIGASGRFVWNKIEKRFAVVEAELGECRKSHKAADGHRAVQTTVIELLWQEVERLAPGAGVLQRAKKLLDRAETDQPEGLWATAAKLGLLIEKEKGK